MANQLQLTRAQLEKVQQELLPVDWCETKDAKTGRLYFYNRVTKQTSWKRPKRLKTEPLPCNEPASLDKLMTAANAQTPKSDIQLLCTRNIRYTVSELQVLDAGEACLMQMVESLSTDYCSLIETNTALEKQRQALELQVMS